jgi:hypothetical protein
MCFINDISCSYRFATLCLALQGYFMTLACSTLKKSNDLLELGIISYSLHFEEISVRLPLQMTIE